MLTLYACNNTASFKCGTAYRTQNAAYNTLVRGQCLTLRVMPAMS